MVRHWLLKSEPNVYAWADLVRDGTTRWDGVRNHAAALHLKAMAAGDLALFYHSGGERACVGVARVTRTAYPDPTDAAGRFVAVEVEAVEPLDHPVTLAAIKADARLARMELVRQSRLSVSPVSAVEWDIVTKLALGQSG